MELSIERKFNFYEKNLGKPVNLFAERITLSGDILSYDRDSNIVTLTNYIRRIYHQDGSSFIESPEELEVDAFIINCRELTTREDRLGRIKSYNLDLIVEKSKKISESEELKPTN